MSRTTPYKTRFLESLPFQWQDRPEGWDGAIQGSTEIAGYTVNVYNLSDGNKRVHTEADTVPNGNLTVYAAGTPQPWAEDDIGYTAAVTIDPTAWSTPARGGNSYLIRIEYTTPSFAWKSVVTQIEAEAVADRAYLGGAPTFEP